MNKIIQLLLIVLSISQINAQVGDDSKNRVTSTVDSTTTEIFLTQDFIVNSSIESVWDAYTTKKGWESWAVAIAEIDFKVNGLIKSNYNKEGEIGDDGTIVLHILNYVPNKMITLQAEVSTHFPEFMKKDEKDLYNIIYFEEIGPSKTKVTSYGIGYKNNEKYLSLLKFFIQGNEMSYLNLIAYLEEGKIAKY